MRERPILMSAPMVQAILAGTKTQTRRIVKYEVTGPNHPNTLDFRLPGTPPANGKLSRVRGWQGALDATTRKGNALNLCPYGRPGDRLAVREAWRTCAAYDHCSPSQIDSGAAVLWLADDSRRLNGPEQWGRYRHARFMPRWACRIVLEITEVRVERLQEISEADAVAEGIGRYDNGTFGLNDPGACMGTKAVVAYMRLWESIHGAGSWDANPWVFVISFRRIGDA